MVDTGFNEAMAKKRGRQIIRPVAEGVAALGIAPEKVKDVIITHMHYDHAGNLPLFSAGALSPAGQGDGLRHRPLHVPLDDQARIRSRRRGDMVRCVFDQRVQFHDGPAEIAPGIEVHHIGGHTKGMQSVRVRTRRGWVVLASDASHFYAHMEQDRAFPILYNLGDMLAGYETLRRLATSRNHIVPGHDPLVMDRYPVARPGMEDWIVRLDADPKLST